MDKGQMRREVRRQVNKELRWQNRQQQLEQERKNIKPSEPLTGKEWLGVITVIVLFWNGTLFLAPLFAAIWFLIKGIYNIIKGGVFIWSFLAVLLFSFLTLIFLFPSFFFDFLLD